MFCLLCTESWSCCNRKNVYSELLFICIRSLLTDYHERYVTYKVKFNIHCPLYFWIKSHCSPPNVTLYSLRFGTLRPAHYKLFNSSSGTSLRFSRVSFTSYLRHTKNCPLHWPLLYMVFWSKSRYASVCVVVCNGKTVVRFRVIERRYFAVSHSFTSSLRLIL